MSWGLLWFFFRQSGGYYWRFLHLYILTPRQTRAVVWVWRNLFGGEVDNCGFSFGRVVLDLMYLLTVVIVSYLCYVAADSVGQSIDMIGGAL